MHEPFAQTEVESEIRRLSELAEKVTTEIATRARASAVADGRYTAEHAKAFLAAEGPVAEREAKAAVVTAEEYEDRKIAEALLLSAQEAGRNYRAQLDALRSINANHRALVS